VGSDVIGAFSLFVVVSKTMDNLFLGRDKIPEKKAKEKKTFGLDVVFVGR
jgi:hypothetical protein